jgi:chromosome segregation ATPase
MEHSQLSQMVTWLDKEHQHDRTELHKLQQQVEALTEEREEQTTRITELEAELSGLRAYVDRLAQIEDYFERFKHEITAILEKSEGRLLKTLRYRDQVRQAEIDNITKAISEIRKETERLRRYDEEAAARRVDMQRLSETVNRLQQQMMDANKVQEERMRSISYLEEQRHQDNKRFAQLQAQTAELLKKFELQASSIQHLEQLSARIAELKSDLEAMRQHQRKEFERMQFQDAQRERQMKSWREEAEFQRQRMDEYEQRMERYTEHHQRIKKAMEDLQEFQEQLQRQQHETSELQRLGENRQRSQLEEWQVQEEQRWKKHTMEWEYQWNEFDKALAGLAEQVAVLEKRALDNEKHVRMLLQMAEEDAQIRATIARDWQMRFEEIVEQE